MEAVSRCESIVYVCFCSRLRTRLFAAQCILELPSDVGSDNRHFDLEAALASPGDPQGAAHCPYPLHRVYHSLLQFNHAHTAFAAVTYF